MIRLLMVLTGIALVLALGAAIALDPHLWAQAAVLLDHKARTAGEDLNAHLNGWITSSPSSRIAGRP